MRNTMVGKIYENILDEKNQERSTAFLDNTELSLVKKLAENALFPVIRKTPGADTDLPFVVSEFANYFISTTQAPTAFEAYRFCIQLYLLSQTPSFSAREKRLIAKLIQRCAFYANGLKTSPDDQYGNLQISENAQIDELKSWRNHHIHNENDPNHPLREFKINGWPSFKDLSYQESLMKQAYEEGMNTLRHPESIAILSDIHNKTIKSLKNSVKREYGVVGFHKGDVHKNVFAIDRNGDIFYTNPSLVGNCLEQITRCPKAIGQVYMGNIGEFQK